MKISIIGGGNLGGAIASGLLRSNFISQDNLTITRREIEKLIHFADEGVLTTTDNQLAICKADVIIIALKPFHVKEFLVEYAHCFRDGQIVISVASGILRRELEDLLGEKVILFRAMPNLAIAVRKSMTCISTSTKNENSIHIVRAIFEAVGKVVWIDERSMNASTVLAACGTAFAMRYIRANTQGGVEIGFEPSVASLIASQTMLGAAQLLLELHAHPEEAIDRVTTPNGCTIAGLNVMEHNGFSSSLIKGICASFDSIA
jgi:pyrroline-5-carboxylate reductase